MENVILVIHLILALGLIGIVLLQRSEGGGLGIGGGGGGLVSARGAANAMTKLTWILAAAFIATSITLTVLAARNAAGDSVIERVGTQTPVTPPAGAPTPPALQGDLLPPSTDDAPATPPKASE
ncbi:MAG: preprotein translocase subunit SecG [Rhodobacteraceae bacterium]|nr:preprotein translocase subunit SecG [Paracoccaceae bacterium]MCB1366395.1 preprotein translocase subunit SecG [Paracoccaceae bacterium]